MTISLIITAGGIGSRFKSSEPKQFSEVNGKSILEQSIDAFSEIKIEQCIITAPEEFINQTQEIVNRINTHYAIQCVKGGKTRAESVKNGFNALDICNTVLIHDAVRPYVSNDVIMRVIKDSSKYDAVIPVIPVSDTIKIVHEGVVKQTPDRNSLVAVQTPQAVNYEVYKKALANTSIEAEKITDDASLVEAIDGTVKIVDGDIQNIKITYNSDLS